MKNSFLRCGGQVGLDKGLCYRCNIFNRKIPFNNFLYFDEEVYWEESSNNPNTYLANFFTDLI